MVWSWPGPFTIEASFRCKDQLARDVIEFTTEVKPPVRFVTEEVFRRLAEVIANPRQLFLLWLAWDKRINRDVEVQWECARVTEQDAPRFAQIAREWDLMAFLADDPLAMPAIADACYDHCVQVMAMFGPRCDFAEVGFSIPGQTPRLSETFGRRDRQRIERPQALGTDTAFVAQFVAGLCLRLLLGPERGSDLLPVYADAPLFVLGMRRGEWLFADAPPDFVRQIVMVGSRRSEPESHTV